MEIKNKIQNVGWAKRPVANIQNIVVHHSAYRQDGKSNQSRFETLRGFHTIQKWPGLSYHYVIFQNGEIWQTNNLDSLTFTDGVNFNSLAILVDGYFHDNYDKPNIEQLKSLDFLLGDLCNNRPEFPATRKDVKGHREVSATVCPGVDLFGYIFEWRNTGKFAILDSQPQPTTTPTTINNNDNDMDKNQLNTTIRNKFFEPELTNLLNAVNNNDSDYLMTFGGSQRLIDLQAVSKELEQSKKDFIDLSSKYDVSATKIANLSSEYNSQVINSGRIIDDNKTLETTQLEQSNIITELKKQLAMASVGTLKISNFWQSKSVQIFGTTLLGIIATYQTTGNLSLAISAALAGLITLLTSAYKDGKKIDEVVK